MIGARGVIYGGDYAVKHLFIDMVQNTGAAGRVGQLLLLLLFAQKRGGIVLFSGACAH